MLEVIHGNVPSKSNCYRIATRGKYARLYKTPTLKNYELSFRSQCKHHKGLNITTHFKLFLDVFYPSRRADLDNSLKVVLDCLQTCEAVSNDRNCIEINARRFVDKSNPRIEFELIPIDDEQTETN